MSQQAHSPGTATDSNGLGGEDGNSGKEEGLEVHLHFENFGEGGRCGSGRLVWKCCLCWMVLDNRFWRATQRLLIQVLDPSSARPELRTTDSPPMREDKRDEGHWLLTWILR